MTRGYLSSRPGQPQEEDDAHDVQKTWHVAACRKKKRKKGNSGCYGKGGGGGGTCVVGRKGVPNLPIHRRVRQQGAAISGGPCFESRGSM